MLAACEAGNYLRRLGLRSIGKAILCGVALMFGACEPDDPGTPPQNPPGGDASVPDGSGGDAAKPDGAQQTPDASGDTRSEDAGDAGGQPDVSADAPGGGDAGDAEVPDAPAGDAGDAGADAPDSGSDAAPEQDAGPTTAPPTTPCTRGWCWQSPKPQANDLLSIWGTSPTNIWAVGGESTMLHYDGREWRFVETGALADFTAITGTSPGDIWLSTGWPDAGAWYEDKTPPLHHWDGTRWRSLPPEFSSGTCSSVASASRSDAVVLCNRTLLHWDGVAWTKVIGAPPADWVASYQPNDIWLVTPTADPINQRGMMWHWDGTSWSESGTPPLKNLQTLGPGRFAALQSEGDGDTWCNRVWIFNRGAWKSLPTFAPSTFPCGLWAGSENDIWVSNLNHWNGTSWTRSPSWNDAWNINIFSFWGSSKDLWAVGRWGLILHYDGQKWEERSTHPVPIPATDLWASAANNVWIVGNNSTARFDGTRWTVVSTPLPSDARLGAIWGASPDDIWAGGSAADGTAVVIRWDGTSWQAPAAPRSDTCYVQDIAGTSANDVWFTSSDHSYGYGWPPYENSKCFTWRWDGTRWYIVRAVTTNTPWLWKVIPDGEGGLWGSAGYNDVILHKPPNRATWVEYPTALGTMKSLWASSGRNVWVSGENGFARFDGSAWSAMFTPLGQPTIVTGTAADDVWAFHLLRHRAAHWNGSGDLSKIVSGPQSSVTPIESFRLAGHGAWIVGRGTMLFRPANSPEPN
jgi:hypothetical protein